MRSRQKKLLENLIREILSEGITTGYKDKSTHHSASDMAKFLRDIDGVVAIEKGHRRYVTGETWQLRDGSYSGFSAETPAELADKVEEHQETDPGATYYFSSVFVDEWPTVKKMLQDTAPDVNTMTEENTLTDAMLRLDLGGVKGSVLAPYVTRVSVDVDSEAADRRSAATAAQVYPPGRGRYRGD